MSSSFKWEWDILVDAIGEEHALKVVHAFSGISVYFPLGFITNKQKEIILKLDQEKKTTKEIALRMGRSEVYIRSVLRKEKTQEKLF